MCLVLIVYAISLLYTRFHVQMIIDVGNKRCIVNLGKSGQSYTMDHCGVLYLVKSPTVRIIEIQ